MLFSASYVQAINDTKLTKGDGAFFFKRQGGFALMGVLAMLAASRFDYRKFHYFALPLLALSIVLLIAVPQRGYPLAQFGRGVSAFGGGQICRDPVLCQHDYVVRPKKNADLPLWHFALYRHYRRPGRSAGAGASPFCHRDYRRHRHDYDLFGGRQPGLVDWHGSLRRRRRGRSHLPVASRHGPSEGLAGSFQRFPGKRLARSPVADVRGLRRRLGPWVGPGQAEAPISA